MAGEKTEKATPKKKRDSRKEGEVVKSIEINNAASLIAIILVIQVFGKNVGTQMVSLFSSSLYITDYNQTVRMADLFWVYARAAGPFLLTAMVIGIAISYLQVGFLFTPKTIMPKGSRINPLQGFKRMFSAKALFSMFKTVLKLSIIIVISYMVIKDLIPEAASFVKLDVAQSIGRAMDMLLSLSVYLAIGLLVNSVVDYIFEWFQHQKKLKMTKQEVKDEHKKTEGDPLIKSNIRSKQQQMARMRMMQDVPKADVVVVNPTHYAVALKYETGAGSAPVVVAKGKDRIALKIKEIARENDVEIVENKPVARMLYSNVEIGDSIPYEYFQAVAEILAYVFQKKNKLVKGLD